MILFDFSAVRPINKLSVFATSRGAMGRGCFRLIDFVELKVRFIRRPIIFAA